MKTSEESDTTYQIETVKLKLIQKSVKYMFLFDLNPLNVWASKV